MPASLTRIDLDLEELRDVVGVGVAGNMAGHLEQAGEATDFTHVAAGAGMPKGIFPWYVPGDSGFVGVYPLSCDTLAVPRLVDPEHHLQLEPELAVMCDIATDEHGDVSALFPRWVAAFDDCSWRRPGAPKISHKKNWGACSKGIAPTAFTTTDIEPFGPVGALRLACFLLRGGELHDYGVDSAVSSYSLFGVPLLDWLVERLRSQRGDASSPLEDVGTMVRSSGADRLLIGVGAPRYEPYGEHTWVEVGDDAVVVLYDPQVHPPHVVRDRIAAGRDDELTAASVLRRQAIPQR